MTTNLYVRMAFIVITLRATESIGKKENECSIMTKQTNSTLNNFPKFESCGIENAFCI